MRSRPTPEDRNLSNPNVASAPSVPVSVYRELAAQLQASKALSESLNAQNQQLLRQNQQLQQELDKAIESVLYWRNTQKVTNRPLANEEIANRYLPPSHEKSLPAKLARASAAEITETEQGRYRRQSLEKSSEISSWSLAIAIVLIMVTAFGAGYLMMRPLVARR